MWSFVLAAGSLAGLWVVGRCPRAGWLWLLVMEFGWVGYSLWSKQFGLGVLCVAYGVMYSVNLVRARRPL